MDVECDDLPEFFNVYLTLYSFKQMLIPREFADYMGTRKLGLAELVAGSNGETWRVVLAEDGKDLYFTDGWQDFVKENMIKDGNFMFFKYHGNLKFSFVIYDETMCEKEKVKCFCCGKDGIHEAKEKPDVITIDKEANPDVAAAPLFPSKSKAVEQSANPANPFFEKCISACSVNISMPRAFVREHSLSYKSYEKLVLRTSKNFSFKVNLINDRGRIMLCGGWAAFVRENNIKTGDICKFELLNRLEMIVNIARVQHEIGRKNIEVEQPSRVPKPALGHGIQEAKEKANVITIKQEYNPDVAAASLFSSKRKEDEKSANPVKPSFEKRISAFSVNIRIPSAFVREHSLSYTGSEKMVLRTSTNSSFKVSLIDDHGRFMLCGGWTSFIRENRIKAGDICKFELLDRLEMKVHIARQQNEIGRKNKEVEEPTRVPQPTLGHGSPVIQKLEEAVTRTVPSSVNPSFVLPMKKYNVEWCYIMNIPSDFTQVNSLRYLANEKMVLRTSKDSTWLVTILRSNSKSGYPYRLSRGWGAFVRDNNIKEGDTCKFELLNRLEMKVHVTPRIKRG